MMALFVEKCQQHGNSHLLPCSLPQINIEDWIPPESTNYVQYMWIPKSYWDFRTIIRKLFFIYLSYFEVLFINHPLDYGSKRTNLQEH